MVILVTGRTAVARVGGISAIRRHVETAKRLGLDPLVLYPARMTALGAEIDAELDGFAGLNNPNLNSLLFRVICSSPLGGWFSV